MATPSGCDGHPLFTRLLKEADDLRRNHPGWVTESLVPGLAAFREDATDAEIANGFEDLRTALRQQWDATKDDTLEQLADLANPPPPPGHMLVKGVGWLPVGDIDFDHRLHRPGQQPKQQRVPRRVQGATLIDPVTKVVAALTSAAAPSGGTAPPVPPAGNR